MAEQNQQILLVSRPKGTPKMEDFSFENISMPEPKNGQVLLKTLYLSVDPYMRGRMSDAKSYVAPFELHKPLNGGIVAEVVESRSSELEEGDIVIGNLDWARYQVADDAALRKIDPSVAPISTNLGILGMPGLTAYFGLLDIGKPQPGETVVVSGAAGAVGSAVGQIAKIKGTRVVGIAGTDEKVNYLKNELGFDEVINYKTCGNIKEALEKACPDGIDVYFENVGGEISDAVFTMLNKYARIPLCGQISLYNEENPDKGPRIQGYILKSSAILQGFIVSNYAEHFAEGAQELGKWVQEGKLKYEENIVEGFDHTIDAFLGLFTGANLGKQLVKVADPSK
ncbi:zinc-binding dehydrogenase family oxidoreductase [Fictibacillus macauensis ZFHKF-1]|uniref:Zinc-binding dehydrogenase family oxidoreductase n=1 Tax=Fictibacillus macauensis ZFHKF-1 TaxID=1196324 RepID=I8IW00_9BACL|nr:NADP-dependent oxidoreductase [Fictibacillus macauensis]EIT83656.1 zinc-binding dehydrogenase family oxidoreductase [Fictibacillus macauensis ZFHKF-1]